MLRARLETVLLSTSGSGVAAPICFASRRKPWAVPDGKVGPVANTKSWVSASWPASFSPSTWKTLIDMPRWVETRSPSVSPGPWAKRTATGNVPGAANRPCASSGGRSAAMASSPITQAELLAWLARTA